MLFKWTCAHWDVDLPFQVHDGLNNLTIFFSITRKALNLKVLTFTVCLQVNFLMLTLCRPNLYRCLKTSQKKKCNLTSHRRQNMDRMNGRKNYAGTQDKTEDDKISLDEVVNQFGFGKFQLFIIILCGILWLSDGMEIMLLTILGPILR